MILSIENGSENNNNNKNKKKIILNLCLVILLLFPLFHGTIQTVHARCWTKCDTCTRTVCDTCYKTVCEKKKVCQTCYKWECDTCKRTVCRVYYKWECDTCKRTVCSTCYKTVCDTCYKRVPYTCTKRVWTTCEKRVCRKDYSGCNPQILYILYHSNRPLFYKMLKRCAKEVCKTVRYPCLREIKTTCYRTVPYKCHCRKVPYKCNCHEVTYPCNCHLRPHYHCYKVTYRCNCHSKPYPCNCREYYDCHKVPYKCNCHKETYPCNCRRICKNEPPSVTILGLHDGATLGTTSNTARLPVKVKATDDSAWVVIGVFVDGHLKHLEGIRSGTTRTIWLTLSPGTHIITAKAWDYNGGRASKSIRVTVVKNSPPSVVIFEPRNGKTIRTTSNTAKIPIKARATDDNGVGWVVVYVDGRITKIGHLNYRREATYTTWISLTPGTHTITIKAYDKSGMSSEKSVRVKVVKVNSPPSVTILEPYNGKIIKTTSNYVKIYLKARATDDRGLSFIYVYLDGERVRSKYLHGHSWTTYTTGLTLWHGTHTITVKVRDINGAESSKSVKVTVVKPNSPPTVTILEPYNGKTIITTRGTVKLPVKVRATDDRGLSWIIVYVNGRVEDFTTGRGMKDYTYKTTVTLTPGTHTVTVEVLDTDKARSKSSITIKVLRALRPSDVSVSVAYQNKVPLLLEKLPVRITIKKPYGDTLIQVYLQKKRTKVLMKQDTCYNTVCTYDLELPLTDFPNIPHASIAYKLLVTFDKDFTVEKTITLTRGSHFATGKEITLIYTIEKGTGPIKDIYLHYNGKKIYPLWYPRELYQQEELTVNVPFKVKVTNTAYATIVVCNYYGCDYRTVKILGTGPTPPPPPPPVTTPTPKPTPKPTPTPPPKPTRPGVNIVKVSVPEISWSHEYSKGGVPTVGK